MKLPLTKKWMVTWKEKEENTVTYDLAAARLVKNITIHNKGVALGEGGGGIVEFVNSFSAVVGIFKFF